ncbi:GNAT family N-acetyltransferase [Vibrio sp. SCSIO 43140]|uniref:GNAT family N-acetyltransferase n=1 Tax=Vibrio sp. SCSIO 43140 TaxID=2819100 RepID=UPI0020758A35|nr:GNAT family N-acetyltransferase [Vibrio sp. SCSIO 43140]USD60740.1 GNAT family N-acetyltransferase [Vibrio sp. SCSIO 43140]
MTIWKTKTFSELTTIELYELLKLRVDVFVVEQTCPYPELDNKDQVEGVHHLLGYEDNELIACARLLPKGTTYNQVSIGRVATKQTHRGGGLGHDLLVEAKRECERLWPNESIQIGAQSHLQDYYSKHGFSVCSEEYLEDDIPHIDMRLLK